MARLTIRFPTIALGAIAFGAATAGAQQSDLSISPFVSFLPSVGLNPMAGLALTVAGNGGFGMRASAHLALSNETVSAFNGNSSIRPWGADADAVFSVGGQGRGGYRRGFSPFAFVGIGTAGRDSAGLNVLHSNWSYGAGAALPLGAAVDLFGESRWRMSRYVLPTARFAPSPTTELRVGLSFHVGPSGHDDRPRSRGRDRREASKFECREPMK